MRDLRRRLDALEKKLRAEAVRRKSVISEGPPKGSIIRDGGFDYEVVGATLVVNGSIYAIVKAVKDAPDAT